MSFKYFTVRIQTSVIIACQVNFLTKLVNGSHNACAKTSQLTFEMSEETRSVKIRREDLLCMYLFKMPNKVRNRF